MDFSIGLRKPDHGSQEPLRQRSIKASTKQSIKDMLVRNFTKQYKLPRDQESISLNQMEDFISSETTRFLSSNPLNQINSASLNAFYKNLALTLNLKRVVKEK